MVSGKWVARFNSKRQSEKNRLSILQFISKVLEFEQALHPRVEFLGIKWL